MPRAKKFREGNCDSKRTPQMLLAQSKVKANFHLGSRRLRDPEQRIDSKDIVTDLG
jgi:hypothetical protein